MVSKSSPTVRRWVALLVVPAAALAALTATAAGTGHPGTARNARVLADLEWDVVPAGH